VLSVWGYGDVCLLAGGEDTSYGDVCGYIMYA